MAFTCHMNESFKLEDNFSTKFCEKFKKLRVIDLALLKPCTYETVWYCHVVAYVVMVGGCYCPFQKLSVALH